MCDYSLEIYRSRPAQTGEKYETRRFPSQTVGIVVPSDASTAVCMACDTRLRLEGIPETIQMTYGVSAKETVTFARLEPGPHHDGVVFDNGAQVTLQQLGPGVQVVVVDALETPEPEKEKTSELV
jgi:hypothetical protein